VAGVQGAHATALLANVPTGHVVAVYTQLVAPWVLAFPAPQGRQSLREPVPSAAEKVPAGHSMHVEGAAAPTKALYLPAAQLAHAVAPASELYLPALQGVQVARDVASVEFDQVPCGQGVGGAEAVPQK
jgi:hypothetical protein